MVTHTSLKGSSAREQHLFRPPDKSHKMYHTQDISPLAEAVGSFTPFYTHGFYLSKVHLKVIPIFRRENHAPTQIRT